MNRKRLFSQPADMEPLMPVDRDYALSRRVGELMGRCGELRSIVHAETRKSVADAVRAMNSYYSNLIEGHRTNPYDIEKALQRDYASKADQKALQQESLAHIRIQKKLADKLSEHPEADVYSREFLCWLHAEFYKHLPKSFRYQKDAKGERYEITPGRLREDEVSVGRHVAPRHDSLSAFLTRFAEVYANPMLSPSESVIAVAASHHRFSWIHPFLDGNGRVVRLMTDAALKKLGLDGGGIWTMSRGLARNREQYYALLAHADQVRKDDSDACGRMSDHALFDFCLFFLDTALDQVDFMLSCLQLNGLAQRMEKYLVLNGGFERHVEAAKRLLHEALYKGSFRRGEAARITNMKERTARKVLKACLDEVLLVSDSEKRPVRLGFPVKVLEFYFPRLYPTGIDTESTAVV